MPEPISEEILLKRIDTQATEAARGRSYLSTLDEHPLMRQVDDLLQRSRAKINGIGPAIRTKMEGDLWTAMHGNYVSTSNDLAFPATFVQSQGPYVWDSAGNRYIDGTSGIAVMNLGHKYDGVERYVLLQRLLHPGAAPGDIGFAPYAELAQELAKIAPGRTPKRVELFNSGTEAMECALKNIIRHTGKRSFLAFQGAFHGRTYGALSLCASKARNVRGFGSPVLPVHHLPFPESAEDMDHTFHAAEDLFATSLPPEEVAALVIEPIQGEGGYRMPPQGFLKALREFCSAKGILLVVDEVQTGMGRTGTLLRVEQEQIEPDVIILGKGLGNGSPLSAVIARREILEGPPGSHGNTNGGINAIAGLGVVRAMDAFKLQQCAETGMHIRTALRKCLAQHPGFDGVRGAGMMNAMTVDHGAHGRRRGAFIKRAFERGLLLLPAGADAVRIIPPLTISKDVAQCIVDLVGQAAEDVRNA
ncbi:MAG: 4-aminobutyrate aminotransferase [Candidatus Peregrinibacteria bacterium Gr01-1014_25]|nr:MAG: 4-aminobutyrate aminotransferase [Candidatus Peregrinibacteria bacterium Gr01-1014_25]